METLRIVILAYSGVFTFAFGLGWIIPLASAHAEVEQEKKPYDGLFFAADLILFLLDCIPFFWIFRVLPRVPDGYRALKEKWGEEASIRRCFYLFVFSGSVTLSTLWFF